MFYHLWRSHTHKKYRMKKPSLSSGENKLCTKHSRARTHRNTGDTRSQHPSCVPAKQDRCAEGRRVVAGAVGRWNMEKDGRQDRQDTGWTSSRF